MTLKFVKFFKPFEKFIPSIKSPTQELDTNTRLIISLSIFAIYSILASIPLLIIGVQVEEGDPFAFIRTITASSPGSLIELGLGPLLIAGVLLYILTAFDIIEINKDDPNDKELYNCTLKVLAMLFTIVGASMLLIGGVYGTSLDLLTQIIIVGLLTIVGVFIIYLDEFISKGWGIGSGIALFILAGVTLQIFQGLFTLQPVVEGSNEVTSARGIILAFIFWTTQEGPITAFGQLFFRYSPNPADNLNLPTLSLFALLCTIIFIFILNYIVSLKIEADVHENIEGIGTESTKSQYNIAKFLVIPVIVTYTIFSGVYFISQMVWRGAGGEGTTNLLANILGTFRQNPDTFQYEPTGGLVYFLTPPRSLIGPLGVFDISSTDVLASILRTVIFSIIFVGITYFFLKKILKLAERNNLQYNENNNAFHEMRTWGLLILVIIAISNMAGVLGSGIGLFLCVNIIREYLTILKTKKSTDIKMLNFYI